MVMAMVMVMLLLLLVVVVVVVVADQALLSSDLLESASESASREETCNIELSGGQVCCHESSVLSKLVEYQFKLAPVSSLDVESSQDVPNLPTSFGWIWRQSCLPILVYLEIWTWSRKQCAAYYTQLSQMLSSTATLKTRWLSCTLGLCWLLSLSCNSRSCQSHQPSHSQKSLVLSLQPRPYSMGNVWHRSRVFPPPWTWVCTRAGDLGVHGLGSLPHLKLWTDIAPHDEDDSPDNDNP